MPIWIRRHTYKLISDWKKEENDALKKNQSSSNSTSMDVGNPNIPPHIKSLMKKPPPTKIKPPSYTTKPSKK